MVIIIPVNANAENKEVNIPKLSPKAPAFPIEKTETGHVTYIRNIA
jgi:predicted Fe-Mo cluster-binding NifX family protein